MAEKPKNSIMGSVVFYGGLAASLIFFWWLLIYDHGIPASH